MRFRPSRRRRGATLIELLVALLLLDLALLSLAGMSAAAARRLGEAGRRSRAITAATSRVERLSALSCASMSGGTATLEPGVVESWTVSASGDAADLTNLVVIRSRAPESVLVRRRVRC